MDDVAQNVDCRQSAAVRPFAWPDWGALWRLRAHQLAEHGIVVDPGTPPGGPQHVGRDDAEWDFHHMADVYLAGAGGFWLAWEGQTPIGYVGAQGRDAVVELRRMYVRANYRRRGAATSLVRALLDHCRAHGVAAVELWTACDGARRAFYETLGFRVVLRPDAELPDLIAVTNYTPGDDEVRMRSPLSARPN